LLTLLSLNFIDGQYKLKISWEGAKMKKALPRLKQLSTTKKVLLIVGSLFVIGAASSSHSATLNSSKASVKNSAANQAQTHKPVITTKTETETQSIPFQSTTVNDSSLTKGTTKVTTVGVNGSETLTYKVTYTDGNQTDKQLLNTTIVAQPVTQVTSVGTYVAPAPSSTCTNGTYVNTYGNTVCSPEPAPSAPAGATAQCVDGTYSFSQSRSGTCSHHGGVGQWLWRSNVG
jgi:hypothetical protein